MFSGECLLGTIHASYLKASPGTGRSWKLRGMSAEAQNATLDPYPYLCFRNPFFTRMGKPNELWLVRPHVAAKPQLRSYANASLTLAAIPNFDLHENLCVNVTAFLKTCHPSAGILCMCTPNIIQCVLILRLVSLPERKESTEKSMRRNLCRSL